MRSLSVLVVDDEVDTRDSMDVLLRSQFPGCNVVLAEDGQEAINALDQARFDLVIVDYRLPFVDGITVARYASQTKRARCLLVTGYADPAIAEAALQDGTLFGILHKTASPAEIIAFLRKAVTVGTREGRLPQSEAP